MTAALTMIQTAKVNCLKEKLNVPTHNFVYELRSRKTDRCSWLAKETLKM